METENSGGVRTYVLRYEEIIKVVPPLKGHRKLVEAMMEWIGLNKANAIHAKYCHSTGVKFADKLINEEFKVKTRIDNEDVLKRFSEGPFITVSNHPFGALDGILLLDLVGKYRPDFMVMVNLILSNIAAMSPAFIPVDPQKSDDPEKKAITMQGIRQALKHVRQGHPLGFFPAGAVSKINRTLHIRDRRWQPSIIRLISQLDVPVVPIYFHGHNSAFFNILGLIDWRLRTLRLPTELFNMANKEIHISIGNPIMPETLSQYKDLDKLGKFLREKTYELSKLS